ncbi:MAG: gfo/Idh/MocA family oxidoreductase [Betaproteobacteria bacterium]|nr:gfo/Idh/MocA family oxidoreductase [Betaproteobacteria bacterium]
MGWQLAGVYDVSPQSLELAARELQLASGLLFDDLDKLYGETKPSCVIVATTADSHCELTCDAAERGVQFILVEKPMATSLEQCDRMIETCRAHGARLAVNHQMRFMEHYREIKQACATLAYGGLASMNIIAGNFGFAMNGTHYFEAFRFLTDECPVEVSAWFSLEAVPNPRGARFEDRAGSIRAVTAGGKRLYMEVGADQGHGIRHVYACRNGTLVLDELTGELLTSVREEQYRDLPTTRYGMPATDTTRKLKPIELVESTAAVLTALVQNVDNVSGEDARRVIELLVAAYQSAEHGNAPVKLSTALDRNRVFPWA